MKRLAFVVKTGIITFIIIAAVSLALLILTRANFLGDLVVAQIVNAVRNELNVELEMSRLTGNPIIGFKGKGLSFVRSGKAFHNRQDRNEPFTDEYHKKLSQIINCCP